MNEESDREASRYAAYPDHPLANVPQSTLDLARAVLAEVVTTRDVDPDMADPIADAVVARLAEAGLLRNPPSRGLASALRLIPDNLRISASLTFDSAGAVTGVIDVPSDTPDDVIDQLRERLDPIELRVNGLSIEWFRMMTGRL